MWRRNEHLGECVLRLQFQRSAESDIIVSVRAKRVFRVGERVNRRLMNAPGPKQSQNRQRLRALIFDKFEQVSFGVELLDCAHTGEPLRSRNPPVSLTTRAHRVDQFKAIRERVRGAVAALTSLAKHNARISAITDNDRRMFAAVDLASAPTCAVCRPRAMSTSITLRSTRANIQKRLVKQSRPSCERQHGKSYPGIHMDFDARSQIAENSRKSPTAYAAHHERASRSIRPASRSLPRRARNK